MRRLVACAFWLLVVGCSHGPRVTQSPTGLKAADFWKDQEIRSTETNPILGKITLRYRGKKQSLSGRGRVVTALPDRAMMELRDPLGRLAYLLSMDGNNVVAYYPSQKRAYLDSRSGSAYLKDFLGLEVNFGELQNLIVGQLPAARRAFDEWEWDADKGAYRGVIKGKDRTITGWVDGRLAVLKEIQITYPSEVIQVSYADFEPCCGGVGKVGANTNVPLANSVSIHMERALTEVEVHWQDIERVEKTKLGENFRVNLPEDTQKIVLK